MTRGQLRMLQRLSDGKPFTPTMVSEKTWCEQLRACGYAARSAAPGGQCSYRAIPERVAEARRLGIIR